jgi:hypothetical protein
MNVLDCDPNLAATQPSNCYIRRMGCIPRACCSNQFGTPDRGISALQNPLVLAGGAGRKATGDLPRFKLGEQLAHDMAVHVGQPALNAVVIKGQSFVIQPEQVQHRRVKVIDLDGPLGSEITDLI